jgi:hypothetical protein
MFVPQKKTDQAPDSIRCIARRQLTRWTGEAVRLT